MSEQNPVAFLTDPAAFMQIVLDEVPAVAAMVGGSK